MNTVKIEKQYHYFNCKLTTLSPIHIGSGEAFSPIDYYYDKKNELVNFVDQGKLMLALKEYAKDTKHFNALMSDLTREIESNLDNKRLNYGIIEFLNELEINPEEVIGDSIPCRTLGTHKVDIQEFINSAGRRFIPGSSIKGAIKTAFMYKQINNNNQLLNMLTKHINEMHWKERRPDHVIYSKIFGKNPSLDFFKAVTISDTEEVSNREIRKIAVFDNVYGPVLSTVFLETIYDSQEKIPFSLKIDDKLAKSEILNVKYDLIQSIKEACNDHTIARIKFQIEQIEKVEERTKCDLSKIEKFYNGLLSITESITNENRIITQIGHGSGFFGTTINLVLHEKAPEALMELRRKFRIGKNKKTGSFDKRFPKTNLLELSTGNIANNSLGWTMLTFEEEEK